MASDSYSDPPLFHPRIGFLGRAYLLLRSVLTGNAAEETCPAGILEVLILLRLGKFGPMVPKRAWYIALNQLVPAK